MSIIFDRPSYIKVTHEFINLLKFVRYFVKLLNYLNINKLYRNNTDYRK